MADQTIQCKDCPNTFVFTEKDQEFYAAQGFTPPKRCKPCRDANKAKRAEREQQGGGR
jgi:hypothetical protein